MAIPSVTYNFVNGTVADGDAVDQNFQDIIDALTNATASLAVGGFVASGTASFNGNVYIGDSASDCLVITSETMSSFSVKSNAVYTIGDNTKSWRAVYLDNDATDGGAVYFDKGTTAFLKASVSGTTLSVGGFSVLDLVSASLKLNTASLTDEDATRLGLKEYSHGTAYKSGNIPEITLTSGVGTLSSVSGCTFIPIQMQDGSWQVRFMGRCDVSSIARTGATFSIAGLTFADRTRYEIAGGVTGSILNECQSVNNTSTFVYIHASATTDRYNFASGFIPLSAKPLWAY